LQKQPNQNNRPKILNVLYSLITFILWLGTAIVGLLAAFFTRQTALRIYGFFSGNLKVASLIGSVLFALLMIIWLVYVIGSGEYHIKHVNQPRSWAIIAIGFGVELVLLILYFVV
jgi:hypothetical protein